MVTMINVKRKYVRLFRMPDSFLIIYAPIDENAVNHGENIAIYS